MLSQNYPFDELSLVSRSDWRPFPTIHDREGWNGLPEPVRQAYVAQGDALLEQGWAQLLAVLQFPPAEMDMLGGLPLHGAHLAVLAGLPFLLSLHLVVVARSAMRGKHQTGDEQRGKQDEDS